MNHLRRRLIPFAMYLVLPGLSSAEETHWTVSEASPGVIITFNGVRKPATKGLILQAGSELATGPNARAIVTSGEKYVVIAPSSKIDFPAAQTENAMTELFEDSAMRFSALRRVQHRISRSGPTIWPRWSRAPPSASPATPPARRCRLWRAPWTWRRCRAWRTNCLCPARSPWCAAPNRRPYPSSVLQARRRRLPNPQRMRTLLPRPPMARPPSAPMQAQARARARGLLSAPSNRPTNPCSPSPAVWCPARAADQARRRLLLLDLSLKGSRRLPARTADKARPRAEDQARLHWRRPAAAQKDSRRLPAARLRAALKADSRWLP